MRELSSLPRSARRTIYIRIIGFGRRGGDVHLTSLGHLGASVNEARASAYMCVYVRIGLDYIGMFKEVQLMLECHSAGREGFDKCLFLQWLIYIPTVVWLEFAVDNLRFARKKVIINLCI